MFNNQKLNYAIIIMGSFRIEGECTYWEMGTPGYVKLIIDGKEYLTNTSNVVLMERNI